MTRTRLFAVVALVGLALAAGGCGGGSGGGDGGKTVYMLLPNTTTPRFTSQDAPDFKAAMQKYAPDTKVVVQNADNDAAKQVKQVENAIAAGAAAIVLVAADPYLASGALAKAKQGDVPVILYDHDARGGPAVAQVIFDSRQVGRLQGKDAATYLKKGAPKRIARIYGNKGDFGTTEYKRGQDKYIEPLVGSGQVKVACETYTPNWVPAEAQKEMEQCLTKTHNDIDAVVVMNDSTAGGVIAALKEQRLVGKVPVFGGQDADIQGVQYVLLGYLKNTVYKPFKLQARAAAKVTAAVLKTGKAPKKMIDGHVPNGYMKPGVPAVFLPVQVIHKDSVQKLVDDGIYTWSQICKGPASKTDTCDKKTS